MTTFNFSFFLVHFFSRHFRIKLFFRINTFFYFKNKYYFEGHLIFNLMAFKSVVQKEKQYADVESLFRDLNTTGIQSLYSHQSDILRHYQEKAIEQKNVAIELPTGSGKTLVGLLIAEFKRREKSRRILYLCPTKQLVNQVVSLSEGYGINTLAFTGSNRSYSDKDKYGYRNGDTIAVTTYSSLFNTRPWFENPDLIIIDDAHTAENYIASCWSLNITRSYHYNIYQAVIETIKNLLPYPVYRRLTNDSADYHDRGIVEKFSNLNMYIMSQDLYDILSSYLEEHDYLKYSWQMLKDHLGACQLYYSWGEILIRPMIPPALDNEQFKHADQRVFMSATLGQGGDLERITGVESFYKIPIPKGWDKQGNGRRFFMFPNLGLESEEIGNLQAELMQKNDRSVVLVSNDNRVRDYQDVIEDHFPDINFFTAKDIEDSKSAFVESEKAVIVLANRFDGIDFSGDQSRLLFLVGIPYASNLQEKFMQSRLNASIIFYDRNKTRLIQAIGRCTRSPKDYSAIVVIGDRDLTEWLLLDDKIQYFHPELQAELKFGIENSRDCSIQECLENFDLFIEQSDDWNKANSEIIQLRGEREQIDFEGARELGESARYEVKFQYALWNQKYDECFYLIQKILQKLLGGKELSGYRAYWNYQLAAVSSILYDVTGKEVYQDMKNSSFQKLAKICPSATWFREIYSDDETVYNENLVWNIERLQSYLSIKNITNATKYQRYLKEIEDYADSKTPEKLELLNLHLGLLLGFKSENKETKASPDPYWISMNNLIYVFEDKLYENAEEEIKIEHIRQAASHEKWIRENLGEICSEETKIITIFLSNRKRTSKEGKIFGKELKYWNYHEFISFYREVIAVARDYPLYYAGENDSNWKDFFIDELYKRKLDPHRIIDRLVDFELLEN